MLTINQRQVGDLTILDLNGRITIGEGSTQFRDAIRRLIEQERNRVVLNFADVNYVDSSGIGELVSAYTSLNNLGGQLKLLNLPKRIKDLLRITKLLTVFEIFEDEATAVRSFQ
ncbi:MAG: STAS domain-containing protein [Acidobacteria bacterium]|nr:STAS domain-containing protein [Acidobacteriota bacterium]